MAHSAIKSALRFLPLVIGPAVLLSIFFFADLSFNDETFEGTVTKVEVERGLLTVSDQSGQSHSLPFSSAQALSGQGVFAADPEASIGQQIPITSQGIFSQITKIGITSTLLVLALTIIALMIQAARLALLYRSSCPQVRWRHAFRALLIGLLYGNVLPAGQVGGDPIKAYYLAKFTGGRRSPAFAAVLVDRALGLAVLAAIAGAAILFGVVEIADQRVRWFILAILVAGLVLTLALLSSQLRKILGMKAVVGRLPLGRFREKVSTSLRGVSASPVTILLALLLSVFAHGALIVAVFVVGDALGLALPFVEYLAKVPVANIVASLPLAPPGGWGFGEWAYMMLFAAVGAEAAFLLSAMPRLAMLFCSLWGVVASWHLPPPREAEKVLDSPEGTSNQEGI